MASNPNVKAFLFSGYDSWTDLPWPLATAEEQNEDLNNEDNESNVRVKRSPFLPGNPFEGIAITFTFVFSLLSSHF